MWHCTERPGTWCIKCRTVWCLLPLNARGIVQDGSKPSLYHHTTAIPRNHFKTCGMAAPSSDSHRLQRRDSSPRPRNSSRRRPRLLRASATEPSITTSSSCKGVLTSPNTNRRATELLNRVAVSNAPSDSLLRSSPSSARSFVMEPSQISSRHISEATRQELLQGKSACC